MFSFRGGFDVDVVTLEEGPSVLTEEDLGRVIGVDGLRARVFVGIEGAIPPIERVSEVEEPQIGADAAEVIGAQRLEGGRGRVVKIDAHDGCSWG
jgi:hypothetical protein